jgi:hypothetical protein
MTAKVSRYHLPDVGESIANVGSGIPFEAMTVKPTGFGIGDFVRFGGKTFVLGKLGATITNIGLGLKNSLSQTIANCAVQAAADAGDTQASLTVGGTDGPAGDGVIAEDYLEGGQVLFFNASGVVLQIRGITGNTAVGSGGGTITLDLDSPLTVALTTAYTGEAMASPWASLTQDTEISHPVVGVATVPGTSGQYIWVQTWGPTWVSPQSGVGVAGVLACYWRHDGSIDVRSNIGTYVSDVYAGFVLSEVAAHTQGAPFFMLQITP